MTTAIALIGNNFHTFNNDLELEYIASLNENRSHPHIVITDNKGNQVGAPTVVSLDNAFDDMMSTIALRILHQSDRRLLPHIKSDIKIHIIRLSRDSVLRYDKNTKSKYPGFEGLRLYSENFD